MATERAVRFAEIYGTNVQRMIGGQMRTVVGDSLIGGQMIPIDPATGEHNGEPITEMTVEQVLGLRRFNERQKAKARHTCHGHCPR